MISNGLVAVSNGANERTMAIKVANGEAVSSECDLPVVKMRRTPATCIGEVSFGIEVTHDTWPNFFPESCYRNCYSLVLSCNSSCPSMCVG